MYTQPQTGWNAPPNESFTVVVTKLIEHRKANPFIVQQHNLSTDYEVVCNEVDEFNAERMKRNIGWSHFLGDASPSGGWMPQRLNRAGAGVVAAVKRTAAGIKVIAEWLGSGLRPVDQSLAEKRAMRCIECPKNTDPNWLQKLDAMAAEDVKKLVEIKNDMKLATPQDNQLLTCSVCDCYLRLKVWVPITHISSETSTALLNELTQVKTASGQGCWVPEEISKTK